MLATSATTANSAARPAKVAGSARRYLEEQRLHQIGDAIGRHQPDDDADHREPHAVADDQRENVTAGRAEGEPDADLLRALAYGDDRTP